MQVIRLKDIPNEENKSQLFTAPVTVQSVVTDKNSQITVSWVHFPKGVRNKFHTHSSGQILIVTEGKGMVATEKKAIEISVGDVVIIPAYEKHRHGAIEGFKMTHIAILSARAHLEQLEN